MFKKDEFANILQRINSTYDTMTEFGKKAFLDRSYISKYINKKLDNPPSPKILLKIADASNGIISYFELMNICGYIHYGDNTEEIQDMVVSNNIANYELMKQSCNQILSYNFSNNELKHAYFAFESCCNYIIDKSNSKYNISLDSFISDLSINEKKAFFIYYNLLIKRLSSLSNYTDNSTMFCIQENIIMNNSKVDIDNAVDIVRNVLNYINNFTQKQLFKSDITFYKCPVYGKISAGLPNWAEECLEGYLPIDPNLMGIVNPEECFFLRVDGESMNKVIRNGAYALIRKQGIVENGEIAAVLVNGFDATLKKFSKQGDLVILEPMSEDSSFTTQVYNKDTQINILGKYIGKFEMNK